MSMVPPPPLHAANRKSAAVTTALLRLRIKRFYGSPFDSMRVSRAPRSGQGDDIEVQDAGIRARQDDGVLRIEQVELLDALHGGDGLIPDAGLVGDARGDGG